MGKDDCLCYQDCSYEVINAFYETHKKLGPGLPEKPYHNGLANILKKIGFQVESEKEVSVKIDDFKVGEYWADLVVENKIIIEVKAVSKLLPVHEVQLINYLRISGLHIGLLVNFRNEKVYFRRLNNF